MAAVSDWDSPEEILSRANDDVDRVAPLTYRDALRTAVKQRDELQAKLDAELPAMWREDIASLNECLERVGRERDTLREENARLNTLLLSATGENQKRAEREARALEDWRELRAENDRLRASRLPDVEYARLDTMWQQLVRERDEARAKASIYERDWYEAKGEFGTATAKLRETVRTLTGERDEALSQVKAWQAEELSRRTERDEARAEVERLRAALAQAQRADE